MANLRYEMNQQGTFTYASITRASGETLGWPVLGPCRRGASDTAGEYRSCGHVQIIDFGLAKAACRPRCLRRMRLHIIRHRK